MAISKQQQVIIACRAEIHKLCIACIQNELRPIKQLLVSLIGCNWAKYRPSSRMVASSVRIYSPNHSGCGMTGIMALIAFYCCLFCT
jgi:hypothetical protein